MHCGLGDHAIVIQIRNRIGQRIDAMDGVVGLGLGLASLVGRGLRLLVDCGCLGRYLLNAGLRARIDILDGVGVLGSQIIKLVGLVDQRRGLLRT